jgi:polyhydroxyalkanoate synthesis repressor PhaR
MGYRKRHSAIGGLNRARRRPLSEVRMSTTRIIKKYPNRRLYDTEESRYITLADVRSLVVDGVNFAVIDKKTDANITRCVLLQVICEQEQNGEAILTEGFLSQVVRVYGNADAMKMADHLEDSLNRFLARQNNFSRDPAQVHYKPETPKTP